MDALKEFADLIVKMDAAYMHFHREKEAHVRELNAALKRIVELETENALLKKGIMLHLNDVSSACSVIETNMASCLASRGRRCQGCVEDQPNQQAHMMPGGCLSDSQ
jgi:hypothetical protein